MSTPRWRVPATAVSALVLSMLACSADQGRSALGDRGQGADTTPPSPTGAADASNPALPVPEDAGAQPTDGAPSVTPGSTCASRGFKYCEDFESAAVGGLPAGWTKDGAVGVVSGVSMGGTKALHASPANRGARYASRNISALGDLSGKHWGRVFFKVGSPAPNFNPGDVIDGVVVHSTMVAFDEISPLGGGIQTRVVDTVVNPFAGLKHQYLYNVQPKARAEFGTGSDYNYKHDDKWHCAEWQIDSAAQAYQLYIDGAAVPKATVAKGAGNFGGAEIPLRFESVSVGWNNYQGMQNQAGYEAWFDELVLNDMRVGCGP